MPAYLRRFYYKELLDAKKQENQAVKKANQRKPNGIQEHQKQRKTQKSKEKQRKTKKNK